LVNKATILDCFSRFLYDLKTKNIFALSTHTHTKDDINKALGYEPLSKSSGAKLLWSGLKLSSEILAKSPLEIRVPDSYLFNNRQAAIFIITRVSYDKSIYNGMEPLIMSFDLTAQKGDDSFEDNYYFTYSRNNITETKYALGSETQEKYLMGADLYLNKTGVDWNILKIYGNAGNSTYSEKYYITSVSMLIVE